MAAQGSLAAQKVWGPGFVWVTQAVAICQSSAAPPFPGHHAPSPHAVPPLEPQGKTFTLAGATIDPKSPVPWVIGALLLVGGGVWLWREGRRVRAAWDAVMEEIKAAAVKARAATPAGAGVIARIYNEGIEDRI